MREFKLAIILALLVVVGGAQAQAKPIRESPAAVLKSERAKLARLSGDLQQASRNLDEVLRALGAFRVMLQEREKRGETPPEGWARTLQKATDAVSDGSETTGKLRTEIERQRKVVAEAEAALK